MFKKEFLLVWMVSSMVMLGMSYLWHGVILNDYQFIKLPFSSFIVLQAIVYMVIGFVLTFVYHYTNIKRKVKYKGFMIGAVLGFFIYLIAYVLGISFKTGEINYVIVVDFIWQMGEQAVGGGVVGFAFVVLDRVEKLADIS